MAGWGKTQEGGNSANILQELQITVLTNEECKAKYKLIGKLVSEQQFDKAVICAGELIGGKDSCQVCVIEMFFFVDLLNPMEYLLAVENLSFPPGFWLPSAQDMRKPILKSSLIIHSNFIL